MLNDSERVHGRTPPPTYVCSAFFEAAVVHYCTRPCAIYRTAQIPPIPHTLCNHTQRATTPSKIFNERLNTKTVGRAAGVPTVLKTTTSFSRAALILAQTTAVPLLAVAARGWPHPRRREQNATSPSLSRLSERQKAKQLLVYTYFMSPLYVRRTGSDPKNQNASE